MIHPTAIVHPTAILGADVTLHEGVRIDPYVVIEDRVVIGANTRVMASAYISRDTKIGKDNLVYPYTTLGLEPQDLKYGQEPSFVEIGDHNVFREHSTVHRGTKHGEMVTRIGHHNLFMVGSHVAHDCCVGDHNIFSHAATLAGHVAVGSHATIGAYSGVHQFCRVGDYAFIGGYSVITQDALPFVKSVGNRASIYGINTLGLQRLGFPQADITNLKSAYRTLFQKKLRLAEALYQLKRDFAQCSRVLELVDFIEQSERGITR